MALFTPRTAIAPTTSDRALRRIGGMVALLFAISAVAGLAQPQPTLAWSTGSYSSASEKSLISLTNRSRAAAGLKALKTDSTLTSVARWRSKDMINRDYFSHDIPGYGSVFKKLDSKGYCYKVAGENIGWNTYPDDKATAAIHGMFMDSSGHRKNILGKAWDVIGIGAYQGPDGKKMWTVLFADKCGGSTAPKPTPKPTAKPKPKPRRPRRPPSRSRQRRRDRHRSQRRSRRQSPRPRRPRPPNRRRHRRSPTSPTTKAEAATTRLPRPATAHRPARRPGRPAQPACGSRRRNQPAACSNGSWAA